MTPNERYRHVIFDESSKTLSELAYRAVNVLGLDPAQTATVAIDANDPAWTHLADALLPGHNWQQYRDQNRTPVARGTVNWGTVQYICEVCPNVARALEVSPPEGHLYAFVLGGGGVSLYAVPHVPAIKA